MMMRFTCHAAGGESIGPKSGIFHLHSSLCSRYDNSSKRPNLLTRSLSTLPILVVAGTEHLPRAAEYDAVFVTWYAMSAD